MSRVLYVFPHPDDESFGPAPAMAAQLKQGHEVFLLTLTRGGATRQRHKLDLSIDEMGKVRLDEMRCVEKTLGLTGMSVLDMPDGGLAGMDPRVIEAAVADYVEQTKPDVLVTYAVHGISGHPDHLVSHQIVKRIFCKMRERHSYLRRLALFTLFPAEREGRPEHLKASPARDIAIRVRLSNEDLSIGKEALACYETYRSVVEEHKPLDEVREGVYFELFDERHGSLLGDIFESMPL
jgi:N-acetylglucosamine malate deacetylase 2